MNRFSYVLVLGAIYFHFVACSKSVPKCCSSESATLVSTLSWKEELKTEIPLL
jgi:hypothetical protein